MENRPKKDQEWPFEGDKRVWQWMLGTRWLVSINVKMAGGFPTQFRLVKHPKQHQKLNFKSQGLLGGPIEGQETR